MADTILTFNGVTSAELGFVVERVGEIPTAERKVDEYDIPGANGKLFMSQDAFYNVTVTYDIYFHSRNFNNVPTSYVGRNPKSLQHAASVLNKWLFAEKGYQQLTDSNDPLYYREAVAKKNGNIENILRKYGKYQVTFDCKPQRFRHLSTVYSDISIYGRVGMLPFSNLTPLTLNSSEPEQFLPSKPLIWVASNTAGADAMLTINGINYQIDNMPTGGVWIDCEKMVVTNFLKTKLANDCWHGIEFPTLYGDAENELEIINGGVTTGTAGLIAPRWFTL